MLQKQHSEDNWLHKSTAKITGQATLGTHWNNKKIQKYDSVIHVIQRIQGH